jgi:hypothetical protein
MLGILKAIVSFLKSPLGKKVVKTAGELAAEGLERAKMKNPK